MLKLTPAQIKWLRLIRDTGEVVSGRNAALNNLERRRLIESDPSTLGANTMWRATQRGMRMPLGGEEDT